MKPPSLEQLIAIFRRCGLDLPEAAYRRFWDFHRLLRARNEELDLTRIRRFEDMVLKHYVDCALVPGLIDLPSPLLDIGAGAGFPGVPLKIVRPDLKIILAESRGKRLTFLDEVCRKLEFEDIEIYPHKVSESFDRPVQGIITRALEPIARTIERTMPFLPKGGRAIFMKGPAGFDEIAPALHRFPRDYQLAADLAYNIGSTRHRRRLIVFERISEPAGPAENGGGRRLMVQEIASAENPRFKLWSKLIDGRGVKKYGLALMSGPKQVREVLRDFPQRCEAVLLRGREETGAEAAGNVPCFALRPEFFRRLDLFGTGPPLLIVRVPDLSAWEDRAWPPGCTLFAPFQDPGNIGAVIRSAAAFGVSRLVLLEEAAHPFHPRSLRAAGPTVFRLPLLSGPSLDRLAAAQAPLFALAPGGRDLTGFQFPPTFGLVVGLEGPGLPENLDRLETLSIPMQPGVESLNAALAASIALYEWRRSILTGGGHK